MQGWADPKSLKPVNVLWPIDGETQKRVKVPSKKKLEELNNLFKSLSKKSNG